MECPSVHDAQLCIFRIDRNREMFDFISVLNRQHLAVQVAAEHRKTLGFCLGRIHHDAISRVKHPGHQLALLAANAPGGMNRPVVQYPWVPEINDHFGLRVEGHH